mmetsp:Transcript_18608/g.53469  ORF Transcript_18608/g.53469 Transcript_18608/m.53469 type:complete len:313 (-) Transcript_18608:1696-2634(-)
MGRNQKVKQGKPPAPYYAKGGSRFAKKRKETRQQKSSDEDWVASLAVKASAEGTSGAAVASSKAAAIERRLEKKRRRNDRLIAKAKEKEARKMAREVGLESQKRRHERQDVQSSSGGEVVQKMAAGKSRCDVNRHQSRGRSSSPRSSSQCLSKLSAEVKRTAKGWNDRNRRPRPYTDPSADPKRGKATKQRKYECSNIQPRDRDYGGLGLARPSQFLPLLDPSFIPKFEAEFEEHIPGFFGKQRTKAMKKQLDGGLLWRRMYEDRRQGGAAAGKGKKKSKDGNWEDKRVNGKKLSDMNPDEKVEAMIKLGMI